MSFSFIIATRNRHKVDEIRTILGTEHRYLTLADLPPTPPVIEDAPTFAGNAAKKSIQLARWLGASPGSATVPVASSGRPADWVLADDSGLEVDSLNGAPGVHSARFASLDTGAPGNSPDADNNAKLLRLLREVPAEKRTARFRCVIALTPILTRENTHELETRTILFTGACEGHIDLAPRGQGGFGYDPLFIPNGFTQSFAELGEQTKNRLSHRAAALTKLKTWLANCSVEPGCNVGPMARPAPS